MLSVQFSAAAAAALVETLFCFSFWGSVYFLVLMRHTKKKKKNSGKNNNANKCNARHNNNNNIKAKRSWKKKRRKKKELPNRENHLWKSQEKLQRKTLPAKCWKIQCDNWRDEESQREGAEATELGATCVCRLLHEMLLLLLLHTCVHNALVLLSSPAIGTPIPFAPSAPSVPF